MREEDLQQIKTIATANFLRKDREMYAEQYRLRAEDEDSESSSSEEEDEPKPVNLSSELEDSRRDDGSASGRGLTINKAHARRLLRDAKKTARDGAVAAIKQRREEFDAIIFRDDILEKHLRSIYGAKSIGQAFDMLKKLLWTNELNHFRIWPHAQSMFWAFRLRWSG